MEISTRALGVGAGGRSTATPVLPDVEHEHSRAGDVVMYSNRFFFRSMSLVYIHSPEQFV
jgi:hypothetical protein